jgi:sugar (pentulose or hexulose) kinase
MGIFYGLDVGTSFLKAAVLDLDAVQLRHTVRAPFPGFLAGLPPMHREVDPGAVLAQAVELLEQLQSAAPRCDGLVLCGQMHGFVLVDERGNPLSHYVSWLDQRVSPDEFQSLGAEINATELHETGNELRPSIAAPLLAWLARRGELPGGTAIPVSVADFIAARLCGSRPILDATQAAAFGALRLSTLTWHEDVAEKLGVQGLAWPEVRPTGTMTGRWRGVPCYATIGDQQCALAGALLREDELSVNIGTGSQVAAITADPISDSLQTRPYFDGRFLRTITHIPAGRALSALIRLFTELGGPSEEEAWPRIEAAVAEVPETDVRAGASFFPGPCGSSGFLENLHEGNLSAGHVFRAVFESMAANYAACARRLDVRETLRGCVLSGGIARRIGVIRDLTCAALGLPHRLSPHAEDTLFGLLVLARAFRDGLTVAEATQAVSMVRPEQPVE